MRIGTAIFAGGVLVAMASCKMDRPPESSVSGSYSNNTESSESSGDHDHDHESSAAHERKKDKRNIELGRTVTETERWMLTDEKAKKELAGGEWGEREIRWFWQRKGWRMTKREERYYSEVQALVKNGDITPITTWHMCPYGTVYQAIRPTTVMGRPIERMQEFYFEGCENDDDLLVGNPRFARSKGYQADHDEGFSEGTHKGNVPEAPTGERKP
jgi:hypothetical protein